MKIEIKNLKHSPSLSQETNAYTCDIIVEGLKAGYAENSGHGGSTTIHPYPNKNKLIQIAEEYLSKQPKVDLGNGIVIDMDLEFHIDNLVEKAILNKELVHQLTRVKRLTLKNIVVVDQKEYEAFSAGKATSLGMQTHKFKIPISDIPVETLKQHVAKIKSSLKAGQIILNSGPAFKAV